MHKDKTKLTIRIVSTSSSSAPFCGCGGETRNTGSIAVLLPERDSDEREDWDRASALPSFAFDSAEVYMLGWSATLWMDVACGRVCREEETDGKASRCKGVGCCDVMALLLGAVGCIECR